MNWKKVHENSIFIRRENKPGLLLPARIVEITNGLKMLAYVYNQETQASDTDDSPIGFMTRITSMVNVVCDLEINLEESYFFLRQAVTELGFADELVVRDTQLHEQFVTIEAWRLWKEHVFSHTPHEKVTGRTRTSLDYFALGHVQKHDSAYILKDSTTEEDGLPTLDIMRSYAILVRHYQKWETLFMEILNMLNNIEPAVYKEKNDIITEVVFIEPEE